MNNLLDNAILNLRIEFLIARLTLINKCLPKELAFELVNWNNDSDAYKKAIDLADNSFSAWMKIKWSRVVNLIQR